ncbi:hypothetical protein BGZ80_008026 [Entomortierella chlamydospora]|uniref:Uncharacterized protein n=1 Tax=Entomortierella chlamydospora TaxID=101097 RepID=A0A9P6T176_9FUNG|nr:hypothetical protein BGZ80_008026 [Entomortierella chlamydospora]
MSQKDDKDVCKITKEMDDKLSGSREAEFNLFRDMESSGKRTQTRREKRYSSHRMSPYARQENNSRTDIASLEDQTDDAPTLGLRLTRFLNPWHKEKRDSELPPPKLDTEETIVVEETKEVESIKMQEEENATNILVSKVETHEVVEYLEENGTSNSFSQTTIVASSQEVSSTPEGSIADIAEDFQDIKRRHDRDESAISGHDSDSTADRRRSKRKLRSSVTQPTRRTTRSLAAKVEEDANREESATPDPESISSETGPATEQPKEEQPEISKSKSGKKKKGKQPKKGITEEIEEIEKETAEQSERIAEEIRKSEEIIKESESLGSELNDLEKTTDEILHHDKSPFSQVSEEVQSVAGAEDDDQTFHSTTQFEAMDTAGGEEGGDEEQLYPNIEMDAVYYEPEDGDGEDEDADTVKYYPPESPVTERVQDIEVVEEEQAQEKSGGIPEQVEMLEAPYDSDSLDDSNRSPSPPAAVSVPESFLIGSEEFEFSPMQSRSPSPRPREPTSPQSEHFVDCPSIVTPKAEKTKVEPVSWNELGMHPVHNIDFLEAFFRRQKGHLLTPMQADYCCQLIMDSVIPSSNTKWVSGEDGVSFRNPFAVRSQESPIKNLSSSDLKPALTATQDTPVESTETSKADKLAKRPAPFTITRQPTGVTEEAPKLRPLPPLDEYLEIEKYKGVEWDDLPSHVRVKRYLEWKGTESPETAKKRRMEERERMRKENAEFWARREKAEAEALVSVAPGIRSKRKASVSESPSDEEHETFGRKRTTDKATNAVASPAISILASPVTATKSIGDASEIDQNAPRAQTVAEKILAIVRKDAKEGEEKKAESEPVSSLAPSAEPSKPSAQLKSAVPTFDFGVATKASTEGLSTSVFRAAASNNIDNSPQSLFGGATSVAPSITPSSTAPSFSFSTPKSDSTPKNEVPTSVKPLFNFGVPSSLPSAPTTTTSNFATTSTLASKPTSPWGTPSGSNKDNSGASSSPWGASPGSDKGTAKTTTSPWGMPTSSSFSFTAPKQPSSPTANKNPVFSSTPGSFSFGVPATAAVVAATATATVSGFGSSKSPMSFGVSNQNPFAAFVTKPPVPESSKQDEDKIEEHKGITKQETTIILTDEDEDGDGYSNDNGDNYDDNNGDSYNDDSGDGYNDDNGGWSGGDDGEDEDEEGEVDNNSILSSSTKPEPQSKSTPRRASGTELFERRQSSTSIGQQPRTPEFKFDFGTPKAATIVRPDSPSPGSKGTSLFGASQFGQSSSSTTGVSTSSSLGTSSWGSNNAPVFTFKSSSNSRGSGFDVDDDDEEEELHFDKYEEDEDGAVSPLSSPNISPRHSPY